MFLSKDLVKLELLQFLLCLHIQGVFIGAFGNWKVVLQFQKKLNTYIIGAKVYIVQYLFASIIIINFLDCKLFKESYPCFLASTEGPDPTVHPDLPFHVLNQIVVLLPEDPLAVVVIYCSLQFCSLFLHLLFQGFCFLCCFYAILNIKHVHIEPTSMPGIHVPIMKFVWLVWVP